MNKYKIIHVMTDEKFLDMAYRDFELAKPGISLYTTVTMVEGSRYIKSFDPVYFSLSDYEKVFKMEDISAVIFHSLNPSFYKLFSIIPSNIKILWIGWGYDYYSTLLASRYPNGLYLDGTLNLIAKANSKLSYNKVIRKIKTINKIGGVNTLKLLLFKKDKLDLESILDKIDYFSPVLSSESALVKSLNANLKFEYIEWNYGNTQEDYNISLTSYIVEPADSRRHILVGNSATPENNHLEVFDYLYKNVDLDGLLIYCPLSYGNLDYAELVVTEGRKRFGNSFVPILNFMVKDKYFELLSTCGHIFMNQLRQQAVGNLLSLISNGAKVYFNSRNPLFDYFVKNGIVVEDFKFNIITTSKTKLCPLNDFDVKCNKEKIYKLWSKEKNSTFTTKLIEKLIE
jgi:dTDP-N-acetylfucosamine:lipid II N-acetylfucosaminyltransferase